MKKLLSFVLSVVMTLSLAIPAFAAESTNMTQEDIRNEIIEIIANADTAEERDAQLCDFLEKNPLEPIQTARSSTGEAFYRLIIASYSYLFAVAAHHFNDKSENQFKNFSIISEALFQIFHLKLIVKILIISSELSGPVGFLSVKSGRKERISITKFSIFNISIITL